LAAQAAVASIPLGWARQFVGDEDIQLQLGAAGWATSARVAGSDVLRAAIAHLAANRPGLDDVLSRARTAKTERGRRRLGR
jgi:hypothetical protein